MTSPLKSDHILQTAPLTSACSAGRHSLPHHRGTFLRPLLIARLLLHPAGRHPGHVLPRVHRGQAHHQEPGGRRDEGASGELQRAHPEDPLPEPADPGDVPRLQGRRGRSVGGSQHAHGQTPQVLKREEGCQDAGRGGGHVHPLLAAVLPGSADRYAHVPTPTQIAHRTRLILTFI